VTANIGPHGISRRRGLGLILLAGGVVTAVVVAILRLSPGWTLPLWVPFWMSALLLVQAREKT
jgi:hypothetical protein